MRLSPSGKKRLVLMHAWFTRPDSRGNSAPQAREIMERISPVLDDMDRAEEYLTESCKDVEWTAVLPGGLNKLRGTTGSISSSESSHGENIINIFFQTKSSKWPQGVDTISRATTPTSTRTGRTALGGETLPGMLHIKRGFKGILIF